MSNKTHPIHCICSNKSQGTCPSCSRIKMVIGLKNGCEHLKKVAPDGTLVLPVQYNFYSKNRKSTNIIIDGMVNRFEKENKLFQNTQTLLFYENGVQISKRVYT